MWDFLRDIFGVFFGFLDPDSYDDYNNDGYYDRDYDDCDED